jgi:hypothetical protein
VPRSAPNAVSNGRAASTAALTVLDRFHDDLVAGLQPPFLVTFAARRCG